MVYKGTETKPGTMQHTKWLFCVIIWTIKGIYSNQFSTEETNDNEFIAINGMYTTGIDTNVPRTSANSRTIPDELHKTAISTESVTDNVTIDRVPDNVTTETVSWQFSSNRHILYKQCY